MSYVFKGLKPERLWKHFYDINQIPRESKHEEEAMQFLVDFAKNLGLPVRRDKIGNVLVTKPATAGFENAKKVCIQGHIDMVCEKNADVKHDFRKDPIKMLIDGEFVKADGTTLGADNAIGIAAGLAVMESKDIIHPAMEFLFTIDEETGLTGATELENGFVTADILLNCDSEEDGALYIGCAGGKDTTFKKEITFEDTPKGLKAATLKISGFKGGHSGLDIHKLRANAIIQLNRVFSKIADKTSAKLYYFQGGTKHNAIPREAECSFVISEKGFKEAQKIVAEYETLINAEFEGAESGVTIGLETNEIYPDKVFSAEFQKTFSYLIKAIPHGVKSMSAAIDGLVETSTNLAIVTADKHLEILMSHRSSVESRKQELAEKVRSVGYLAGCEISGHGDYPGWNPNIKSPILKFMTKVYEDLYGKTPEAKAIHAGLECGLIGETVPGMDMISFGPTINNPHSPSEEVQIDTVSKFWDVLVETLKRIAEDK